MIRTSRSIVLALLLGLGWPGDALAQDVMRGHGGPVRALAVNADTRELISGSFDSTVIVWDLDKSVAKRVLRFHDGPVNAVAVLVGGCFASGGEDKRIALWCGGETVPRDVMTGHQASISSLSSAGPWLHSSSFDGKVRTWGIEAGRGIQSAPVIEHNGALTGVVADPNGGRLAASSADGTLFALEPGEMPIRIGLAASITTLARAGNGETVVASADGGLKFVSAQMMPAGEMEIDAIPLASLALSPDGRLIATAGLRGGIAIVDRASRKIVHRLTGPGLPVWSLVFDSDSRTLLSGGADRVIRRWDAVAGKAITSMLPERDVVAEAAAGGERGAVVFRACQACHTLSPDGGNRAGPTLHGIFGRRIGTAPGYVYSEALPKMGIVWNAETIARLFEVGPNAYTPGTKMPEQTISNSEDRHALVEWLERVTR